MSMQSGPYRRTLSAWFVGLALAAMAATGDAAVLTQQAPVDGGNGYYSNTNTPQQQADDFTLGGAVSLEGITWWGGDAGNAAPDDNFLVRLYSDLTGTGSVLKEYSAVPVTRTATSLDSAGNAIFQYDLDLSATPEGLAAGTYYLFVQNLGTTDWFWLVGAAANGAFQVRAEDTDNWAVLAVGEDLAFSLNGTRLQHVPEPGSLSLLALAGLSLALVRKGVRRAGA